MQNSLSYGIPAQIKKVSLKHVRRLPDKVDPLKSSIHKEYNINGFIFGLRYY